MRLFFFFEGRFEVALRFFFLMIIGSDICFFRFFLLCICWSNGLLLLSKLSSLKFSLSLSL